MEMIHFKSEDEFWKAFEQFNFLYGHMFLEWKPTTARKEHIDLFNVRVAPRETYFRRELGGHGYDSAELLSMSSMEKTVYVVIGLNPALGDYLQNKLDQKLKELGGRMK